MKYIRIKNLREEHNRTQLEVADYIGVTKHAYSNYENGKTKIPLKALIKLADYYNVSVDYLIEYTNDPIPHERKCIE